MVAITSLLVAFSGVTSAQASAPSTSTSTERIISIGRDFDSRTPNNATSMIRVPDASTPAVWRFAFDADFHVESVDTHTGIVSIDGPALSIDLAQSLALNATGAKVNTVIAFQDDALTVTLDENPMDVSFPVYMFLGADSMADMKSDAQEVEANNVANGQSRKRPSKVGVPSNYIYNPKMSPKWLHDYCTWSRDKWKKADFRGPCARHDLCYEANPGKKSRNSRCQTPFRKNLKQNCNHAYYGKGLKNKSNRLACRAVADGYYRVMKTKNNAS